MRRIAALGVAALASLASGVVFVSGTTLAAGQPTVATGAASNITDTTASLQGTVNAQGQPTVFSFQYGTTALYGRQTTPVNVGSGSSDTPVTSSLSSLTPGTTYHFRVVATNAGGTAIGSDQTFKTDGSAPAPAPAPTVTTGSATASTTSAEVQGSVNPNGASTGYYFEFGTTTNYGNQTLPKFAGSGSSAVAVSATLSGLQTSTTYHYRLVAVASDGTVVPGKDATFTVGGSKLSFFGHTSFADQNGVGGIFLGCFGSTACNGKSLTIGRSGKTLGVRTGYTISANDGGIVHFNLNDLGKSLLKSRGSLRVNTTVVDASGATVKGVTTLQRFMAK